MGQQLQVIFVRLMIIMHHVTMSSVFFSVVHYWDEVEQKIYSTNVHLNNLQELSDTIMPTDHNLQGVFPIS